MLQIHENGDQLLNEVELCQELNITKQTLDGLRQTRNFPFYRLTTKDRCYSVKEVLAWLKQHKAGA